MATVLTEQGEMTVAATNGTRHRLDWCEAHQASNQADTESHRVHTEFHREAKWRLAQASFGTKCQSNLLGVTLCALGETLCPLDCFAANPHPSRDSRTVNPNTAIVSAAKSPRARQAIQRTQSFTKCTQSFTEKQNGASRKATSARSANQIYSV